MPEPTRTGLTPEDDQRWPALLIATLSSFLTPFMLSAVNIALPAIGRHFGADAVLLSWVATAYLLAASVSLMPFGKLSDLHGRKRVFLVGMTVFTASSVLCGLAGSVEALIAFRVVQGVGIAMVFATGIAILTSVTPPDERGRALGITVAAVYLGLACGPFAGGWLTEHLSWRGVFLANAPLGLGLVLVTLWKLKGEWAGPRGEPFDLVGTLVYAAALAALMLGGDPAAGRRGRADGGRGRCGRRGLRLVGAAGRAPDVRGAAVHRPPGVRLLVPGRAGPLQRNLRGDLPDEPLPAVHQGPLAPGGRHGPDRAAGHDGAFLAPGGPALRPHGAARALVAGDGDHGRGAADAVPRGRGHGHGVHHPVPHGPGGRVRDLLFAQHERHHELG